MTGKFKLAPMKNKLVTIPRLELQVALMASRIRVTTLVQIHIAINSVFYGQSQKLFYIIYEIQKQISENTLCDDATKFEWTRE